ncbi:hypothetical protein PIB30_055514 [Stylosanthes scabra]|uniref:Uncharacterized protein n=1 Tax=Stylosanthes scabra TaxID=79078 RepID=A0ABU6XJR2_9FABA|nr:hypothetical protein [Stylosanthes scabra]
MEEEEEGPRSPTATATATTLPADEDGFDDLPSSPPPAFLFHRPPLLQPATAMAPLYKQRSWSPDVYRDEAWLRRKGNWKNRRSRSVTDEDVDELKACIELGFGFESSPEVEPDQRLSDTLPALELYYAVNKSYNNSLLSKPPAPATVTVSSTPPYSSAASDDCESTSSSHGSPHTIFTTGDNPQTVKTRLRQWAQVVACAVRQNSG